MDINKIDWNSIWREGAIFFGGKADKVTSWNRAAPMFNTKYTKSDYGKRVIERLKLQADWTVLDVGAGPGLLALPMAKACKHVTALDGASEMLRYLKQNAEREGVSNITYVNKLMGDTTIGVDIPQHDIVIASRSMGWEHDVRTFLKRMDEAAKRYAYLTWGAEERTFDIAMYKAIGRPYGETREYIILYNLLYQMGIRANIEIFESTQQHRFYSSIDETVSRLRDRFKRMNMNRELTPQEETKLRKFLEENLTQTSDGTFTFNGGGMHRNALIWWDKKLTQQT
jgi:ubiquinone/menaquinone biosynthesis C-methylase UbiE